MRIAFHWVDGFGAPVLAVLVIANITMSFQVMRTARINPADTLRYEFTFIAMGVS